MVLPTADDSRQSTPSPKSRGALYQRSDSQSNINTAIRLVPYEPELLEDERDKIYSRTPLPTSTAHILPPSTSVSYRTYEGLQGLQGLPGLPSLKPDEEDRVSPPPPPPAEPEAASGPGSATPSHAPQTPQSDAESLASRSRAKPPPRKLRKHVAVDPQTKTFKVLDVPQQDDELGVPALDVRSPVSPASQFSGRFPSGIMHGTEGARSSTASWFPGSTVASTPTSSTANNSPRLTEDPVANSPWNYALIGGVRKVPQTPEVKQGTPDISNYPLPLPDSLHLRPATPEIPSPTSVSPPPALEEEEFDDTVLHHDLSEKPSFQSALTASSGSGYTNYKTYEANTPSLPSPTVPSSSAWESSQVIPNTPEAGPATSSSTPNYEILSHSPSLPPPSSTPNYQVFDYSPTTSEAALPNLQTLGESSSPPTSVAGPSLPPPSSTPNYQIYNYSPTTSEAALPNFHSQGGSSSPSTSIIGPSLPPPSRTPNYQVFNYSPTTSEAALPNLHSQGGSSSPSTSVIDPSLPQPSSTPNYQILGYSPTVSEAAALADLDNLGGSSSPSTSLVGPSSVVRPTYSQESLVVPPLRPRARSSSENIGQRFGHGKEYSRESHRTGSVTSLSTVFTHEASEARVVSGSIVQLQRPKSSTAWADPGQPSSQSQMQTHPHVWSSQLSTVASESDTGTDRGSRAWSDARRSSGALSPNSHRRMPSISSSMMLSENHSWGDSLDKPQLAYFGSSQQDSTGSRVRMVEDHDEYGDVITDMPGVLRPKPSRSRVSGFFSSTSSTRSRSRSDTMRSAASSRANSLLGSAIPTWAKLYYGSGERKYLAAPGSSADGTESRPQSSSFRSASPDAANFPLNIYSSRRRPKDTSADGAQAQTCESSEIAPIPPAKMPSSKTPSRRDGSLIHNNYTRTRRVRTPSTWSPHLRRDRRSSRTSMWDVPSVNWSVEPSLLGRRNRQVTMFIIGFIFPISWIVAAFLPLPPAPPSPVAEGKQRVEELDEAGNIARQFGPVDELRYVNGRWWRNLNRGMAIVGVLIIIVIIILAVVGSRQGWS